MANRTQSYDVVVIGGGLSGLLAATAARLQGADVALLAEGSGMLELSSANIDLLGTTPEGQPVSHPWGALTNLPPTHPYRVVGLEGVREALEAFQSVASHMGYHYTCEPYLANQHLATAVGRLRPTYLAAPGMVAPKAGQRIWVVGLRGMKEFHPGVAAEGLRTVLPGTNIESSWVDLPAGLPQAAADLHPVQLARLFEEPAFRAGFAHNLAAARPAGFAPELLLLPAVLGLEGAGAVRTALSSAVAAPVGEVPLLSPSIPGLRLATFWQRYLQRAEVAFCQGARVTGGRTENGRVVSVTGETAAGPTEFRAAAFVMATGGLLGQGLVARDRTITEPIFGLPVTTPVDQNQPWADGALLPAGGHPFARAGIRVDGQLRPAEWTNLYVCGRMLAGYDPYAEGSGGGVAVASGWRAGLLAGGAAR